MSLLLTLVACTAAGTDTGSTGSAGPCEDGPAVLVGNGESGHVSLVEGQDVVMVHGPQGGWHIWYSFVAYNFGPIVDYTITGRDEDLGLEIVEESLAVATVPLESIACGAQVWGIFGYLPLDAEVTGEAATPPNYLAGHTLTMGVDLVDLEDTTVSATHAVTVRATCDPVDVGVYPGCDL